MKVLLVFPFRFALFSLVISVWTNLVNRIILSDFLNVFSDPVQLEQLKCFLS